MAKLIITSSSPMPRRRARAVFSGATMFEPDAFTEAQLAEIIADPVLTVVYGDPVTDAKAFIKKLPKAAG